MRIRPTLVGLACVLAPLAAHAPAARAQDGGTPSAAADTAPVPLPPLRVRALMADEVAATPGAAAVLRDADVERLRPYTLHDAFDFVPGVRTIDDDALGRRSGIGIRGAPGRRSRKTLLLEDGTPINGSAYLDPSAHYTPPLDRLERVEVLKGAGQLVHGPLNNHGIINFRNVRPTAHPRTRLRLGGGPGTVLGHLVHTRTAGPAGVVLAYTGMDADGVFDVETHRFHDLFGSVELSPRDGHAVTASLTHFRERSRGYDEANLTPEQFAQHPRGKALLGEGREHNNIAVDYVKADAAYDARLSERLSLSTRVFRTDLDRPRFQTRSGSPAAGGTMEGSIRRFRTAGVETRLEWRGIRALGGDHTLQGGVRHERHRFDDRRPVGLPGETLDHGNRGRLFAVAGEDGYTASGRFTRYGAPAYSAFVQDAIRFRDWIVTPGVRVETYGQRRTTVFRPGHAEEGVTESDWNTLVLPGVSVLYRGAGAVHAYAGVHRGFAPAIARTESFPLVPETGINAQVGVRAVPLRGMQVEVAGYFNRIQNTLIRRELDRFGDGLFVNAADSHVRGVDVAARMGTAARTGRPHDLFVQAAYGYTRARFVAGPLDGNRVPEVPAHAGSITVGVERGSGWHLSGTVSHFGAFYADEENTVELDEDGGRVPGRTLLSARASYTPRAMPAASLWVQGRNLRDRLYVSDVQDGLRPGAPRTVTGGVTVTF